ncbi:hypothetical protein LPB73_07340 [Tardiphaga sp. 37S4]|uniref:hypothetical protein n=1 Tax=Tardiphaga sp. 37S4 TaxID=1404741 RepID=UPI001E3C717B|nr:hypothetical protein [Tardiphaga sp. 37S4]UFS77182.1 hypothetical protein LPB73_07340 [Tardiphaga sp. 37S4]
MALYRGQVSSAMRGKRGQALLKDILIGMNGMTLKQLIAEELAVEDGAVCAIGAAGKLRGVDMSGLDPEDAESVAGKFNVADCLAREIVYMNDDTGWSGEYETVDRIDHWGRREVYRRMRKETPEERFRRMRKWVRSQIKDPLFDVVWC